MENKVMRYPLDLQLFADDKKGDVIDADKELEKVPLQNVDDDNSADDVDEDDIVDDDEEYSDEDEDDSLYDDEEDDDDSDDEQKKKDKDDKSSKKDESDKKNDTKKEDDKKPDPQKKQPQNRDANHEQKLLREQREAEEKARKENFQKGFIAALGGKNPYTGEEIKTDDDIHEAQVMIEAKKRGLDPIQDYSKMDKILRQEERVAQEKKAQAEKESRENIQKDVDSFKEKYPDEDINAFLDTVKDSGYEDLVGKVSLVRIHEIIDGVKKKVDNAVEDKADLEKARRKSTPGSVGNGGDANGDFYSKEELEKMSPSELKKNWAKVERSYDKLSQTGKR